MMHPLVELAKKAIEEYIKTGEILSPPAVLTPEMEEKAGVFICLKKGRELRGCIGTFMPCCRNVAEEIIRNAVSAATQDPRFHPVERGELPDLSYTVDILSPPEKIEHIGELDPKRYGVIVVQGRRKGLLLPAIEEVETAEEQIRIAKMKGGISLEEPADIYRFEVRRYH